MAMAVTTNPTHGAFATLEYDGNVFTWGNAYDRGDSWLVADEL